MFKFQINCRFIWWKVIVCVVDWQLLVEEDGHSIFFHHGSSTNGLVEDPFAEMTFLVIIIWFLIVYVNSKFCTVIHIYTVLSGVIKKLELIVKMVTECNDEASILCNIWLVYFYLYFTHCCFIKVGFNYI